MLALNNEQQTTPLPLRLNKHFRIKSASKDKFKLQPQLSTVKSRRKDSLQEVKRIFSESRNKKSASLETAIKIKITKEELQRRFEKASQNAKKKNIVYDSVKTEQQTYTDRDRNSNTRNDKTEQILLSTQRHPTFFNLIRPSSNQKSEQKSKLSAEPQKFKKIKNDRQPKGKYRCRVNQFVFDHSRKKSIVNKEQQQNLDQFWKNVNQSLILAGKQEVQFSKDLQQFVEHFVTQ